MQLDSSGGWVRLNAFACKGKDVMPKRQQFMFAALLALAAAAPHSKAQSAAQNAAPAATPAATDVEARRKENDEKLARAAAEEEKRLAAIKVYEREQAEREKQFAREKAERDAQRARAALESQCQFKPVMTDEDIARCRALYRN
jgi:hypothetical protein